MSGWWVSTVAQMTLPKGINIWKVLHCMPLARGRKLDGRQEAKRRPRNISSAYCEVETLLLVTRPCGLPAQFVGFTLLQLVGADKMCFQCRDESIEVGIFCIPRYHFISLCSVPEFLQPQSNILSVSENQINPTLSVLVFYSVSCKIFMHVTA